jgi:hypothetical protein
VIHVASRAGNAVAAPYMSKGDRQAIPYEIRDAVELWAREWGRHGNIEWKPQMNCAVIEFTLRGDDPRLRAYQEGQLKHEPKECVFLHYQPTLDDGSKSVHYMPLNLEDLGVSGVIEMLNRGNTWSGCGEYKSFKDAAQKMGEYNDKLKNQIKSAAIADARLRARDDRRHVLGVPFVSVPQNIGATDGSN